MAVWGKIKHKVSLWWKFRIFDIAAWFLHREISRLERANEKAEWNAHFEKTGLRNHEDTTPYGTMGVEK